MIIYVKNIIFKETALALFYTITKLGYKCNLSDNINTDTNELYIILGANEYLGDLPRNYIVYQFEQTNIFIKDNNSKQSKNFKDRYINILKNATHIWDYSKSNVKYLKNMLKINNITWVPIFYSQNLEVIKNMKEKPIDILFYGSMNPRRAHILNELNKKYNVEIRVNDLWDKERDDLISKSKIVINIHYYENAIVELHRISYLLCNKVLVISEIGRDYKDLEKMVIFSDYNKLIKTCDNWLSKTDSERYTISMNGYHEFRDKYNLKNYLPKLEEQKVEHKQKRKSIDFYIPKDIESAETVIDDKGIILKMPLIEDDKLPYVSIITPTYNRRDLFSIAIRNFLSFIYPSNKLEWVIIDDGNEDLSDMLPFNDNRINYIRIKDRVPLGRKRNLCIENSKHNIIISMDDDDYYPPESVIARVKLLLKYPNIDCVGCCEVGCYNLTNEMSSVASDGMNYFSEASMGFRKSFWLERQFNNNISTGEGKGFLQYRQNRLLNVPFQFILIAINHGNNISGNLREVENFTQWYQENKKSYYNLMNYLDSETQLFFLELVNVLKKKKNLNKLYKC